MTSRYRSIVIMACFIPFSCFAGELTLEELAVQLKGSSPSVVHYKEVRESPWLREAVTSAGTLLSVPPMLEKRVESPNKEVWRLYPDRMEWIGANGIEHKEIFFKDSPQLSALASAMRGIVSGDIAGLTQDFEVEVDGNEKDWTIGLLPRAAAAYRYLKEIEVAGTDSNIRTILVLERQGEKTTTYLYPNSK